MRVSTSILSSLLAVSLLACSATHEDDSADGSSEAELRVLGSDEIAGTIAYGTSSMEIENPGDRSSSGGKKIYRALRFEGTAGDEIVASAIGANAADPVLYLLGNRFGTVKYNDDREDGAKDSELSHKLSRSGTYYLAFRTKEGWRTKFYVSLKKKGDAPPPPPPPPPPPASWKTALSDFKLWGVHFDAVLPGIVGYLGNRRSVSCKITPASSTIACGIMMHSTPVYATIQDDGSFASNTGGPRATGGEVAGRVAADGSVTLTRFRRTECFQTSSTWCEQQQTDGQNVPAQATPYRMCRTPDVTGAQGGRASGAYVECSKCADYGGCVD